MSNQKHTVNTDALDTLGTCPIPENSGRDAIHLAVEPAVAGMLLRAGQPIKLVNGVAMRASSLGYEDATGIVDPFLYNEYVRQGDKFWFVVLPRTITSLRHVWSHPAFPEAGPEAYHADSDDKHYMFNPEQSMAMAQMKEWCAEIGERYDYIMAGAKKFIESGEYTYGEKDSGALEGVYLPDWFWDKYQTIVGKEVPERDRDSFFTCSC